VDARGKVWFRGGVDVEVLRGRPRGELVLAQIACEVGAVIGERVVVEADHWARQSAGRSASDTVVVVVDRVNLGKCDRKPKPSSWGVLAGVRWPKECRQLHYFDVG
jgi:hypothetical protein